MKVRRFRAVLGLAICAWTLLAQAQTAAPPQGKALGEIKSIGPGNFVLTTDEGKLVSVSVGESAKVVRIPPGATDLKNAIPMTPQDLTVGDRVLARGQSSPDNKTLQATSVIVMKQSDLAVKQQQEREDWIKRGIGGLVNEVNPAAGTVTIAVSTFGASKKVAIDTTKKTVIRRYAPDSIKFDDAKPGKLADIHVGDQLRARGNKNEDGTEFKAEEIVTGTFRNIAGTVTTVNAADNSLTVLDLLSKKPVTIRVAADSQLRKLPPALAQRIAMRMKGQTPEGAPAGTPAPPPGTSPGVPPASGAPGGQGAPNGRAGDLQQLLSRSPAVTLNEFQKGDAVIVVSTEGNASGVTAITMVGGVEPILTAAPSAQAMTLSPWSLSGGQGESQ